MRSDAGQARQHNAKHLNIKSDFAEQLRKVLMGIGVIYRKNFHVKVNIQLSLDESLESLAELDLDQIDDIRSLPKKIRIDPKEGVIVLDGLPITVNPRIWETSHEAYKVYTLFSLLGTIIDIDYDEKLENEVSRILIAIRRDLIELSYVMLFLLIYTDLTDTDSVKDKAIEMLSESLKESWEFLFKGLIDLTTYEEVISVYAIKLVLEALNNQSLLYIHEKALKVSYEIFKEISKIIAKEELEKHSVSLYI